MPGRGSSPGRGFAHLHQVLDLGDADPAGSRAQGVEVAGGLAVDQVAQAVALPGVDDGKVGGEAPLHHVLPSVERAHLFAFRQQGAHRAGSEEGRDAGAAAADALGQRTLGAQLDFEFAAQELLLEVLVLAHVARDHLLHLAGLQKDAQPVLVGAAVVADDGEVLDPFSWSARMRFSGFPQRPNPPLRIDAPSSMSKMAASAFGNTLFIARRL